VTPINLRRARKAKARAGAESQAAENRRRFGAPKSERERAKATQELERSRLESHRLEKDRYGRDDD